MSNFYEAKVLTVHHWTDRQFSFTTTRDPGFRFQSGQFTKEWVKEYKGGLKKYNALLKAGEKHSIEKVGERLRSMMPWMAKKNIKGVQASY